MNNSVHDELRHRGKSLVEYPDAGFLTRLGGGDGVAALIDDLYRRIEQDDLLREVFPHFNSGAATPFFMQWFGGGRGYSDDLAGGLVRRHQHRYISPRAAEAWLRCMREALVARGLDAEPIMRPLARIAKAMIHNPERGPQELCKSCDAVQDAAQVHFEALLDAAAWVHARIISARPGEGPDARKRARNAQPHAGLGRDVPQPPENPRSVAESRRRLQYARVRSDACDHGV